ncbi:MAG: aldo/keto reductase [Myxococcota bacterium]|nr:aldo/keto reductase [Myxococcota bacterium]
MQYARLGRSGLKVSKLSMGSWMTFGRGVDLDTSKACIREAYDRGVNFFDHAEAYARGRAEEYCGEILSEFRREDLVLSSKVFWGGSGPNDKGLNKKHVFEACHAALKRLRTDYLDLYFCHRPDPETPVEETVRAMHLLIQQGKILYWGTSEWPAEKIEEAYRIADSNYLTPPTMEQPEYNMFNRHRFETEYASLFEDYGLGTTIWSPLASGLLTGKYNDGIPPGSRATLSGMEWMQDRILKEERIDAVKKLQVIAGDLGCSIAQLAIAWCAKNDNVSTVITGATKVEQVVENLDALEVTEKLSDEVMASIESVIGPLRDDG